MSQGHQCLGVKWELLYKDEPGKAANTVILSGPLCAVEAVFLCFTFLMGA